MINLQVIPSIICMQEHTIFAACFAHLATHNCPFYHILVYFVKNISNVPLVSVQGVVQTCTLFDLAKYWNLS